ncbi:MAG: alpha-ribazole phosphatase family protein [Candidatus Accumulibacter sp.]|jgi:alpha-ribazole phosphatase|nr:alpha-ribazole phosphatase family protein [Accumulibacter sp.]
MRVFLIRHPRPSIAPGLCYGRLDVDCEDPFPVAEKLKGRLPEGARVFSSPLRRARRLAEALAPEITVDARLAEIDFGEWEGKAWDSIDRKQLDAWARDLLGFVPPGGESVAQLRARAVEFAETLREKDAVLVTHAGVLRALVGYWRGLAHDEWTRLEFDFGALTVLDTPKGGARNDAGK